MCMSYARASPLSIVVALAAVGFIVFAVSYVVLFGLRRPENEVRGRSLQGGQAHPAATAPLVKSQVRSFVLAWVSSQVLSLVAVQPFVILLRVMFAICVLPSVSGRLPRLISRMMTANLQVCEDALQRRCKLLGVTHPYPPSSPFPGRRRQWLWRLHALKPLSQCCIYRGRR